MASHNAAHTALLAALQRAASQRGARLLKNVQGYDDLRNIRYGLGGIKGTSDLIGWTPVMITPDMVGTTVAVFTAVEAKTGTGRPTREQAAFLAAVNAAGGRGILARSTDDLDP